jgi:ribosomal protein S12 methylthiotransferase accessory factor
MTLADVVSPYVGLVTELDELLPSPDDARQFHVVAAPADPSFTLGRRGGTTGQPGSAYGCDRARARSAAVAEAVERYSAAYVPDESLVVATARELGPSAPAPESFALFAPEQLASAGFPFAPFTADTRLSWVRGTRLADGARAWLPAQLVYLGAVDDEPMIAYSTSNGLAAGPDRETALSAALLELVERDAFMFAWNTRRSFPLLDWERSPRLRAYHRRYLAPARAQLSAVDLSSVHDVPVVLALVRGRPGALVVGAGAARTVEEAWLKAVTEAFAVRKAARERILAGLEPPAEVLDFPDHIAFYAYEENARHAGFLDASSERRVTESVRPVAVDLAAHLAARDFDTYAVDVTSPDVCEAGLCVMRAIAPRLIPLDVRHDARFLGGDRLRAACPFSELNPDPHPFP